MAYNQDPDGYAIKRGSTDTDRHHQPFAVYEKIVDYSDLTSGDGDGDSDEIACTDFPTGAWVVLDEVEIVTAFAGEADLALTIGDTADADGRVASFNLNAVAAGRAGITAGVESGAFRYEADYATAGAKLTFSATDLGDVTAGKLIWRCFYLRPALSTD